MSQSLCFCGSSKFFKSCCGPFLVGKKSPLTAEQLMRSRYSAFATKNADYIKETMKEPALSHFDENYIKNSPIFWLKCEIIQTKKGLSHDIEGEVLFKAYFKNYPADEDTHVLTERSFFRKDGEKWFYVDGQTDIVEP